MKEKKQKITNHKFFTSSHLFQFAFETEEDPCHTSDTIPEFES